MFNNRVHMKWFAVVFAFISAILPAAAFAQEAGSADASPPLFFLLEAVGVVIALTTIWFSKKAEKKFGGFVGEMLKTKTMALWFIAAALMIRAFQEISGNENFIWEVIFELPIYFALVLMAVGSWKLSKNVERITAKKE